MQYKDFSRATRRHHVARLKKARKHFWGNYDKPMEGRQLGVAVATPAVCSCPMCGNARRWFGWQDMQERKHYQVSIRQLLDEAFDDKAV